MVKIEDGIPVPPSGRGGRSKYPWLTLEVGQSFVITESTIASSRTMATQAARNTGRKFKVAQIKGGARVWRVA